MRILVITSVSAERDAIFRGITGSNQIDVETSGVGSTAAAVKTMEALGKANYHVVVSAGIGGGFAGQADVGSIVMANQIIAADLGAQTDDGFVSLDELGFGTTMYSIEHELLTQISDVFREKAIPVHTGPILTVSTVTGTEAAAQQLISRVPDAKAEAMEGFGVASAAHNQGVLFIEIRTISNLVGPRDRDSWRIEEALTALEAVSSILSEVNL